MRAFISDTDAAKMFLKMDAGFIADLETHEILYTTDKLDAMFGYLTGELADRGVIEDLVPLSKRKEHAQHVANHMASGAARMMGGMDRQLMGHHKSGHDFPVEVLLSRPEVLNGRTVGAAKVIDMTSRTIGVKP